MRNREWTELIWTIAPSEGTPCATCCDGQMPRNRPDRFTVSTCGFRYHHGRVPPVDAGAAQMTNDNLMSKMRKHRWCRLWLPP